MAAEGLSIRMLKTVHSSHLFLALTGTPMDTFLLEGHEYDATANKKEQGLL